MLYCKKCSSLYEDGRCPTCGSRNSRPAGQGDVCFLTEKAVMWSDMLADVLGQNGVPFTSKNVRGAGLAVKTGLMSERVRFYVFYENYDEARDIVDELFSGRSGDVDEAGLQ